MKLEAVTIVAIAATTGYPIGRLGGLVLAKPAESPPAPALSAVGASATTPSPTLSDQEIVCLVGQAEGTRDRDCSPTSAYYGHRDPGNGHWNLGSFSSQHGAMNPEEADQAWLPRLREAETAIQRQALAKWGGAPLSKAALVQGIDLYNQSPAAAKDYVERLRSADPTPQEIIDARAESFIDPATQTLDAPGLGNSWERVGRDQKRRVEAILSLMNK